MLKLSSIALIFLIVNSIKCFEFSPFTKCPKVNAIKDFNLKNYMGVWYETMRLPVIFEKNVKCNQAEYKIIDNTTIQVNNSGFNVKLNKYHSTIGKGVIINPDEKSKLLVKFTMGIFDWFKTSGEYNVIDTDYVSYALVYSCKIRLGLIKNEYAWILSRKRVLDSSITSNLTEKLKAYTNDTDKLIISDQSGC